MTTKFSAKTRAGRTAHFDRVKPGDEVTNSWGRPPYVLLGFITSPEEPELWTAEGRWLDTGEDHPYDLLLDD